MKITNKILSIPPYISTSWDQVRSLFVLDSTLHICLVFEEIKVPDLTRDEITAIFCAHEEFLQQCEEPRSNHPPRQLPVPLSDSLMNPEVAFQALNQHGNNSHVIRFGLAPEEMLRHDADQAEVPDLPNDVLDKIIGVCKLLAPNDFTKLLKPEPGCNCVHCQIAKALQYDDMDESVESESAQAEDDAAITDKDLTFREWNIEQIGDNLFSVASCQDDSQVFRVFLGNPVGCTCGNPGCAHIVAVLKS